jgi:hypothetical protein
MSSLAPMLGGAQILVSSIETSDLISTLYTHRQRHPQGQDGGQIGVFEAHMAPSSSIKVEVNTKSDTLTPHASRETPQTW